MAKAIKRDLARCLKGRCSAENPRCDGCGFDKAEAERRKALPLERREDGLLRKIIRRKTDAGGTKESSEQ